MIVNVPLNVFHTEDGKINEDICRVGNEVPMMDGDGNPLTGVISEITDDSVRMDFNHPMAGLDLFFTGKIISVSEATPEEIAGESNSCSSCGTHEHDGCGGCH
jgi:FKBP-type peptidyl-prolyl cis-trans isomerase SlyD